MAFILSILSILVRFFPSLDRLVGQLGPISLSSLLLRGREGPGILAAVTLDVSTPALLFPAISLLFLAYTNRFLHLAALIRQLYGDWSDEQDERVLAQIANLRKRLILIRWMQFLGAVSLFLCVGSMVSIMAAWQEGAKIGFWAALVLMGGSLACLMVEVWISGGALRIMLKELEER